MHGARRAARSRLIPSRHPCARPVRVRVAHSCYAQRCGYQWLVVSNCLSAPEGLQSHVLGSCCLSSLHGYVLIGAVLRCRPKSHIYPRFPERDGVDSGRGRLHVFSPLCGQCLRMAQDAQEWDCLLPLRRASSWCRHAGVGFGERRWRWSYPLLAAAIHPPRSRRTAKMARATATATGASPSAVSVALRKHETGLRGGREVGSGVKLSKKNREGVY